MPVQVPESDQPMPFPINGIDLSVGFEAQSSSSSQGTPTITTPVGQNVRAFEPITHRGRGGSRPGLSKYISGQVNGSASIQDINSLVVTNGNIPGSSVIQVINEGGSYKTGTNWTATPALPNNGNALIVTIASRDGTVTSLVDSAGNVFTQAGISSDPAHGLNISIWYKFGLTGVAAPYSLAGVSSSNSVQLIYHAVEVVGPTAVEVVVTGGGKFDAMLLTDPPISPPPTYSGPSATPTASPPATAVPAIAFTGLHSEVLNDRDLLSPSKPPTGQWSTAVSGDQTSPSGGDIAPSPDAAVSLGRQWLILNDLSTTNPLYQDQTDDFYILNDVHYVTITVIFKGVLPTPVVVTPGTASMTQKPNDVLLSVAGGTVKVGYSSAWQNVFNGAALSSTEAVVRSAPNGGKMYYVDGNNWKYYDPADNAMHDWKATKGKLPGSNLTPPDFPRLIATWRGRTVVSAIASDPRNWFMSAVDDPNNWDTAPTPPVSTQAVLGNDSPLGLVGDVITALIAYTDDVLVIGGDHTIWLMNGDPMAGGQINLCSDIIGMAFGNPWCKDPYGNLYFVSNLMGLYVLVPNQGPPKRISQQIEQLLSGIDISTAVFRMLWDDGMQGIHVFTTNFTSAQAATHFFWEQRTGAWWTDVYGAANLNPKCCYLYPGNSPTTRAALIGSWDGYVRKISDTATTDDGQPIASAVVIGPITSKSLDEFLVKDIQAVLGTGSGQVTYAIYVGSDSEIALASTAVATGTWSAGRSLNLPVRRSGHGIYVKLTSTNQWAMESIRARIAGLGKVRKRGR